MKKICFAFNHLQFSDGVARSAIAIANNLVSYDNVEITICPIFRIEKNALSLLDKRIIVKPLVGFYFRGLSKILDIVPKRLLHNIIFGKDKYDIEIGFQYGIATKAVISTSNSAKHIVWMHGYDNGLKMKEYYVKADKVVCVSKNNAERLQREIGHIIPIDYCYNLIDEKKIIEQGHEVVKDVHAQGVVFVSVGRLSEEKGYMRLIEAARKLDTEGFIFTIWIIGDGPQYNQLVQKVNDYNLQNKIFFFGNQSNPHKYTSKADVFICSSHSEGYSTACTEAIMLGIPVITTDVSGAMEIIVEAKGGVVVPNSIEGIYEGMKDVLLCPQTISEWSSAIMATRSSFYAENRVQKLLDILEITAP